MKASFDRWADITVRAITLNDIDAYRDYWKGLSDPAHFSGMMGGKDADDFQTYKDLFEAIGPQNILFGLFDKDRMIGQTGIFFLEQDGKSIAMFQGSEITEAYRGLGLSQSLYEARMRYLHESGYEGKILTSIRPDNEASLRAAEKGGFKTNGDTIYGKLVLERSGIDFPMP